ncbi:DUF4180 domain-containing protein [Eubacteriaceae bacterium ES3]|nr:DUF4180 domain-containing protein [Eubacteriaceae bacterium ES3]
MNIQHVILGLLSFEPLTGYDMKKLMQKSPLIYWSGNNSQIYKALAALESDGLVTVEIEHDSASPTKKRYSLSDRGRIELITSSKSFPELPELKKPFLLQLTFGQGLSRQEFEHLLNQYEGELRGVLLTINDQSFPKSQTKLESVINNLTLDNIRQFYEAELSWVQRVRQEALPLAEIKDHAKKQPINTLEYAITDKDGQSYLTVTAGQIHTEQDGLALVSACAENGTNMLMLPSACLSEEFLLLSTGLAQMILQKIGNYNIKTVAVYAVNKTSGRFKDFLLEANQGQSFKACDNFKDAENWLLGGNLR